MWERFKCFNVNFKIHNIIKNVHLVVCIINKLQNSRCNDKDKNYAILPAQVYIKSGILPPLATCKFQSKGSDQKWGHNLRVAVI
jgi:hypothetical protein